MNTWAIEKEISLVLGSELATAWRSIKSQMESKIIDYQQQQAQHFKCVDNSAKCYPVHRTVK